jgi:outer membrane protein assembly factor BamD
LTQGLSTATEHSSPTFFRQCDTVRRVLPILVAAVLLLPVTGCNGIWQPKLPGEKASAEDLFQAAQKRYKEKSYREAISLYDRLKSAHPDFVQMPNVYQRIADAYYSLGEYEEAISRYNQFLQLYPNNPGRYRAKYQIGMCYFKRMPSIDRDATFVRRAEAAFKSVVDDPTAGEWRKKAEEKYKICRKRLGEKELYKAETYLSLKRYKAARMAAQRVIAQYPGLGLDKRAQSLIEKTRGR